MLNGTWPYVKGEGVPRPRTRDAMIQRGWGPPADGAMLSSTYTWSTRQFGAHAKVGVAADVAVTVTEPVQTGSVASEQESSPTPANASAASLSWRVRILSIGQA